MKRTRHAGGRVGLTEKKSRPKPGNKDAAYEERMVAKWTERLEARRALATEKEAGGRKRSRSVEPAPASDEVEERPVITEADESRRRATIHTLYIAMGMPEEEEWPDRGGTIAEIRHLMGEEAPVMRMNDPRRFKVGTPTELWSTMERLWDILPSSERIVEDISALPVAISKIIAAQSYRSSITGRVVGASCVTRRCTQMRRQGASHSVRRCVL